MHRLLSIPELLRHIFLSLRSPKPRKILNFALVSKFWAAIALPLFWGHPKDTWMVGREVERLTKVVDIEMEKGSRPGQDNDFPHAFAYGSYPRKLAITSEYNVRDSSTIRLLLTQGVAFPALRALEYSEEPGLLDDNSAITMFLQVLGPTVESVVFYIGTPSAYNATRLGLALRRVVDVCPELTTCNISYTEEAGPIPRAILERHLPFITNLTTLSLCFIVHTRDFIQQLSSSVQRLVCFDSTSAPDPVAEIHPPIGKRERGFANLTTLNITDFSDVVKEFLSSIVDCSNMRELTLLPEVGNETRELIPSCFSPRNIESFNIDLDNLRTHSFAGNILASISRFRTLRVLCLSNLAITDMQLVTALDDCSYLERLKLPRPEYVHGTLVGLSLGCLAPILSRCPLLHQIWGRFDLDQQKLPSHGSIVPHHKLNRLSLGASYFTTQEPEGWISPTLGYLSSLSRQSCNISLEDYMTLNLRPLPVEEERRPVQKAC